MKRRVHQKQRSLFLSFSYAFNGVRYAIYSQRNMWIHCGIGLIAVIFGYYFNISLIEWVSLIMSISFVIITELLNTAIELSVDLTTRKKKYRAKLSKDVAAAAVLIAAINACAIGYLIFYNRFVTLIIGG